MEWIYLAYDRDKWQVVVESVMRLNVPCKLRGVL